jgi:hypothetical protein
MEYANPSGSPRAFGTDLLNKGCRSEIWHQERRDKDRADNGFGAVEDNITRDSDDGQDECKDAFQGKLEKLQEPYDRRAYSQSNHFWPGRDAVITKERVT